MKTYGSGVIEQLPSGSFRVRRPTGRGGYKSLGTYASRAEAETMLAAVNVVAAEGSSSAASSLAAYGETQIMIWKAEGKKTWDADLSRWTQWVVKHADFARDPIDTITRADVKRFARGLLLCDSERARPVSNQTIKHVVNLLRRVFFEAVDTDAILTTSPCEGVKVPQRKEVAEDHWTALTVGEMQAIARCDALTLEQRTVFLLACYTGLRQGELAGLFWVDVHLDVDAPHVWVRRSWRTSTKTDAVRRVDLIPAAAGLLRTWRQHMRGNISRCVWGHQYAEGYDWGWALTKDYGRGVCWIGAKRQAGIVRPVWFHHLRDTCASHLLTGTWGMKWSIGEVSALLGHTDTWVTERYARIMPGALAPLAAQTNISHASPTLVFPRSSQVPEIEWHAMGDSNPRPLAPEAKATSRGYARLDGASVSVRFIFGLAPRQADANLRSPRWPAMSPADEVAPRC
jgi:integrase